MITDGAGNNKSMWSQFGISGKLDAPHHFIEHPWEPSQNIYFLCDVPHIVKCVRNHLRKHTYGMVKKKKSMRECLVQFNSLVLLLPGWKPPHQLPALRDAVRNKHVRVVPKLTAAHVAPANLRKMSVRLATQVNCVFVKACYVFIILFIH